MVRFVTERPPNHFEQAGEEDFFRFDADRARLNLREVKNVADEIEQVGAGPVNRAGEFDLPRREIAVGVVGELLAENEDAVQRRAQLVRHVREEFRFVLRSECKLRRFLFDGAAGLFDFLILTFDFDVLFGKLLRFLRELFVGLLQFALLRLQFGRELLRLFQQAFGLHRGFNRVEHDADARRELLEKGEMRRGERAERCQLDNRFDAILKQNRKHYDVTWHGFKETRSNRRRASWKISDQHAALFGGALAD